MIELNEVLYQWQKNQNITQIARSLGISRPTVRKYLKVAMAAGFEKESDSETNREALVAVAKAAGPAPSAAGPMQEALAFHLDDIRRWLTEPDMTAKQVWRLLTERGHVFSYTSVKRFVKKLLPAVSRSVTVRLETDPGHQAQVDFGLVTLTLGGVKKRLWAFVMALAFSRHRFVRFVERQDTVTWLDCHIRAFEFFGGVPHTVLLDNLKAGVAKADRFDPAINRAYQELERHYGFVADPAKVRTPEHKGKVERSMPTVRQQLVAGRAYDDLGKANEAALSWCLSGIGALPHGTTREEPVKRFEREEKASLLPLPACRFEIPLWKECTVHPDHHVVFDKSYYSVPTRYVGKTVWVRGTFRMVEVFSCQERIKIHPRAHRPGSWQTDMGDYPEGKKAFLAVHPAWCRQRGEEMGEHVARMISEILSPHSLQHLRKAQAVIRLGEKYGAEKLDAACRHLLSFGSTYVKSLARILEHGIPGQEEKPTVPAISKEGEACLHPAQSFGEVAA